MFRLCYFLTYKLRKALFSMAKEKEEKKIFTSRKKCLEKQKHCFKIYDAVTTHELNETITNCQQLKQQTNTFINLSINTRAFLLSFNFLFHSISPPLFVSLVLFNWIWISMVFFYEKRGSNVFTDLFCTIEDNWMEEIVKYENEVV